VDLRRPSLLLFSLHIDVPSSDPQRPQAAIGVVSPVSLPQSEQLLYLHSFFSLPKQPTRTSLTLFSPIEELAAASYSTSLFPNQPVLHPYDAPLFLPIGSHHQHSQA
jgi:hypothetical protein